MGQSLPFPPARQGAAVSLPLDVSRTIEELLDRAQLDFVHVHEPFAPSASSAALRHSRALNVGTFHASAERVLSTQVARRLVELLFGRLDGRTTSFAVTRDLLARFFPGEYDVISPGADVVERAARDRAGGDPVLPRGGAIGAARVPARAAQAAARPALARHGLVARAGDEPAVPLSRALRERVRFGGPARRLRGAVPRAGADRGGGVGAASRRRRQLLLRAVAGGAVPVASRLPVYEEALADGERGLLFEPRDWRTLASQLERPGRRRRPARAPAQRLQRRGDELAWAATTDAIEELYERIAARRHDPDGNATVRQRLGLRSFVHVDLHMHTDHSPDCATSVDTLLDDRQRAGSARSRSPTTTRSPARWRRGSGRTASR